MDDVKVSWHFEDEFELDDGTICPAGWWVVAQGSGYAWKQRWPVSAYEDEAMRPTMEKQAIERFRAEIGGQAS